MLILPRKVDEVIQIGDDISVMVLGIEDGKYGRQVKLGIQAPRRVEILRGELLSPAQAAALRARRQHVKDGQK